MGAREQRAIITAYGQATAALRRQMLTMMLALFRGLGSWRDADAARFLVQAVPLMAGAQRQMTALTDAYLSQLAADIEDRPAEPLGIQARDPAELRNGTPPEEVYQRPFRTVYQELGEGSDLAVALDRALNRLWSNVATDLQLAKTHASNDWLNESDWLGGGEGRRYYRRILTGTSSCGLCVVASTQRYHRAKLLPIHPGCDCAVGLIDSTTDPGQVINEPLLENVHEAVANLLGTSDRGARDPDYRDVIIEHEHGEYGPVLARRRDNFTGPDDLNRRSGT